MHCKPFLYEHVQTEIILDDILLDLLEMITSVIAVARTEFKMAGFTMNHYGMAKGVAH